VIDTWTEAVLVVLAGVGAGTINTVVGSGTLITFPTLLAFGVPPVVANVTNTVGLLPGGLSGAWADKESLVGQGPRLRHLASASLTGAIVGAILLLWLPSTAFKSIVPVLIGLGVALVIAGPAINRRLAQHSSHSDTPAWWVWPGVWATGVYGGYFGAAQGVLLMAFLGIGVNDTMRRHNATKNILSSVANGVAALMFVVLADVDWRVAPLIALGAVVGGQIGARIGKRLPPTALRAVIVLVGLIAIFSLLR